MSKGKSSNRKSTVTTPPTEVEAHTTHTSEEHHIEAEVPQHSAALNAAPVHVSSTSITSSAGSDVEAAVEGTPSNSIAVFVKKSISTLSEVAENVKEQIPASVNEQFVTRACDLWSKLHQAAAPLPLAQVQTQLFDLYREVLATGNELKHEITSSRDEKVVVRVRRVSEKALLVSIRGLTALVDFAERSVNLILPADAPLALDENAAPPCLAIQTRLDAAESFALTNPTLQKVLATFPEGTLPRRVVTLPFSASLRLARQVNFHSSDLISILQTSSLNRMEQLAHSYSEAKARLELSAMERFAKAKTLGRQLTDKAVDLAHVEDIKAQASLYAAKLVQLRKEAAEAVLARIPAAKLEQARALLAKYIQEPALLLDNQRKELLAFVVAFVAKWRAILAARLAQLQTLKSEAEVKVSGQIQAGKALVISKKDEALKVVHDKKEEVIKLVNDNIKLVNDKKTEAFNLVEAKKQEALKVVAEKKEEALKVVNEKKDQVIQAKDSAVAFVNDKKTEAVAYVNDKKTEAVAAAEKQADALISLAITQATHLVKDTSIGQVAAKQAAALLNTEVGKQISGVAQNRVFPVVKGYLPAFVAAHF